MVSPGATSEDIRREVFKEFESHMRESGIDEEIKQVITEQITAKSPPDRITDEVLALIEGEDAD